MSMLENAGTFTTVDVELDVSAAVPVQERCVVACSVFIPDELPEHPTVVVALPGGTYSRRYYDLDPPGKDGYSEARYFARRGLVFAAMDYLSGGDSSRPKDGEALTMEVLAAAAHAAFEALRAGLSQGSFGHAAIQDATYVGIGWSFGGCATIVHQGTYGDYDGVVIRGYSPISLDAHEGTEVPDNWDKLSQEERRSIILANNTATVGMELDVYHGHPREGTALALYYQPGMDDDLHTYDSENLHTLVSRSAGVDVMTPGFARPFAEQITCPVMLTFGDTDVVSTPRGEGRAYINSRHITTIVTPDMAHVHNFADTRQQMWDQILIWIDGLDAVRAATG